MAALLGIGLMPALYSISPTIHAYALVFSLCHVPQIALIAGYFNRNREGRRYSRPPAWLILAVLAAVVLAVAVDQIGSESSFWNSVLSVIVSTLVMTPAVFLSARAVSVWLQPRLRVYLELTEYLRVMWVPIGGFAIGYLVIILLFAGFLRHAGPFQPGIVHRRRRRYRHPGLGVVVLLHGAGPRLPGHRPGLGRGAGPGRVPVAAVDRLGAGRVRRGDVVHPAAARTDCAAARRGRERRLNPGEAPQHQLPMLSGWAVNRSLACCPLESYDCLF